MRSPTDRLARGNVESPGACACVLTVDGDTLVIDATACDGDLASSPACREDVVRELDGRVPKTVVLRRHDLEYRYDDLGIALLAAAGRFVDRVVERDERLATVATRDPLLAAREASTRGGPVSEIAAESGLSITADAVTSYEDVLTPVAIFSHRQL
ncbi:hypothetical protein ACYJ1Y_04265 [Natrialbaceae archaeon A-gly3]